MLEKYPSTFCPKIVDDFNSWILFEKEQDSLYCFGSISKDRFLMIQQNQLNVIQKFAKRLDGQTPISNLCTETKEVFVKEQDMFTLLSKFIEAGLIENANIEDVKEQELEKFSYEIGRIDLRKYSKILNLITKFYYIGFKYFFWTIISLGILFSIANPTVFIQSDMYKVKDSYLTGTLLVMVNSTISLILHELGHIVTAIHYGLKPKFISLGLYYFVTPVVYVSNPGIYTLPPKNRVKIFSGGIVVNLFLFSIFICILNITGIKVFYLFAIPNLFRIVTNLSPFMPLDGYLIISTILKQPNLRRKAYALFSDIFRARDKKIKHNNGLVLWYMIFSSLFMTIVLSSQIILIIKSVVSSYRVSNTVFEFIYHMRLFFILIGILVTKKIIVIYRQREVK